MAWPTRARAPTPGQQQVLTPRAGVGSSPRLDHHAFDSDSDLGPALTGMSSARPTSAFDCRGAHHTEQDSFMTSPRTHAVVHARRRPPIVAILLAAAALVLVSPNPAQDAAARESRSGR